MERDKTSSTVDTSMTRSMAERATTSFTEKAEKTPSGVTKVVTLSRPVMAGIQSSVVLAATKSM